jgi:hypothetical protein
MARDPKTTADTETGVRRAGQRGTSRGGTATGGDAGGEHHAAKAHGRPARVDETLPASRAELLALHAEARKRRNTAPLGSDAFRAAVEDIGRIEIRIAAVDRAADPPLG